MSNVMKKDIFLHIQLEEKNQIERRKKNEMKVALKHSNY